MTPQELFRPGNRLKHNTWNKQYAGFYDVHHFDGITVGTVDERGHPFNFRMSSFGNLDEWIIIKKEKKELTGFAKFIKEHNL